MSKRAEYEAIASRDSATFDTTFQTIGSASAFPTVLIKWINNSDKDVTISKDGVTSHDFVPAGGFCLYDLRTNHGVDDDFDFSARTQWYVSGAGAGSGSVYLVRIYEYA